MAKSIIQDTKECYVCGTTLDLHKHHIYEGTANRKKSEQCGCWCYLCGHDHNLSNDGVHLNRKLDLKLKCIAQSKFEETHSREEFIKEFGKSWLD